MKIYALQTARAGSKTVPNKNIEIIDNKPLFYHNISTCEESEIIEKIFITTDCDIIKSFPMSDKVQIIDRPKNLCLDNSSHKETMKHAILEMEKSIGQQIDIVLILLGNSCGLSLEDIEKSYEILLNNHNIDSIESVSKFNMFNPFRAMKIKNGFLKTFLPDQLIYEETKSELLNDKNSAGDIYFFNGSFWLTRRRNIFSSDGCLPYQWLGQNVYPYKQGVEMEVDAKWQLEYLKMKKGENL